MSISALFSWGGQTEKLYTGKKQQTHRGRPFQSASRGWSVPTKKCGHSEVNHPLSLQAVQGGLLDPAQDLGGTPGDVQLPHPASRRGGVQQGPRLAQEGHLHQPLQVPYFLGVWDRRMGRAHDSL